MTTLTVPAAVALDDLAALIAQYDAMVAEADKWTRAADVLKRRIQAVMGEAAEATIAGRPVFTWRHTGQFNEKRFATDNPDLALKYTRTITVEQLDRDALAAEQPDLYTAYRARRFERKA